MNSRRLRIVAAGLTAELVPILVLVAVVFVFSTGTVAGDQALAGRVGRWLGPIAGALMTFLAGCWAAQSQRAVALETGLIVGVLAAANDVFNPRRHGHAIRMVVRDLQYR